MLTQERGNANRVNMLAQPELASTPPNPGLYLCNYIIPIAVSFSRISAALSLLTAQTSGPPLFRYDAPSLAFLIYTIIWALPLSWVVFDRTYPKKEFPERIRKPGVFNVFIVRCCKFLTEDKHSPHAPYSGTYPRALPITVHTPSHAKSSHPLPVSRGRRIHR